MDRGTQPRKARPWVLPGVALLLLSGAGCAASGAHAPTLQPRQEDGTTVLVTNDGLSTVAIYGTHSSARLGTVMPGERRCLQLWPTSDVEQLIARPVGGGANTISPPFEVQDGEGWNWTLRHTPELDRLSLVREAPCAA